ncbi:MAG: peptidoglycan-binding protein [Candidatus Nanopelagicales bacterium]|nr:peptidoglycan-binding protein [Candidatus Nanopelagicales bacterium]
MRRTAITAVAAMALLAPSAPALADSQPILAEGMQHPAVKRVQKALGISPQTGFFGPVTLAAVKKYQADHAIPTTGVVGPLTWASLGSQQQTTRKKAKQAKHAQKAKKKSQKAKRAKRSKNQSTRRASDSNPHAAMTLQYGDRGAAVLFLQKQLAVQPQTGYFGPITQAYVKAERAHEARDVATKAQAIFEEQQMDRELAFLKCLKGVICRLTRDFVNAEKLSTEAIEELPEKGPQAWRAEAYYELGILYRQQKRYPEAVAAFRDALDIARAAGLSRHTGRYLRDIESLDETELYRAWMKDLPEG